MKKETKQNATLKDVARETGYSINTVSRALRDKDDIAPETREKIKSTAKQLGYVNNMLASSLRLGYTNTIAVLLGDVSNPHFGIMMKEIEEHARELGYTSFLMNTGEDDELEYKAIQSAINKNVDGIIICPTQKSEKNIKYLKETGIPFVLIGRKFEDIETDYVICNDELGGHQATRKLIELGHRDILMLNGPMYISSARDRFHGYLRAHRECGLPIKEELIREVPVTSGGCAFIADEIAKGNISCTAIFAFSDMVAWDMWSALQKYGLRVPADYSLIGFDHIQSRLALPFQLSSISSYKARMSVFAVDALICKMQNKKKEPTSVIIDTKVAEGDTLAPLSEKHS